MSDARLDAIGGRIERLTADPDSIPAPFTRLARPLLYRIGWRPTAMTDAVTRLVRGLAEARAAASAEHLPALRTKLLNAVEELEGNLGQVERATVINRRALVAHAGWLRRLYEVVVAADRAVQAAEDDARVLATVLRTDEASLLAPLAFGGARPTEDAPDDGPEETGSAGVADPTRVLEIQLDAIDHIMALAREERTLLGRRRRLLEAARQLLLDTSAALPLDPGAVAERSRSIAQHITRLNRLEAAGLRADVGMLHQARTALSRGQRDVLYAALVALETGAHDARDGEMAELTGRALRSLRGGSTEGSVDSVARSASEVFGARVIGAVEAGYSRARERAERKRASGSGAWFAKLVRDYLAPGGERATLANALAVDGCFDVGGVLSPIRVEERYLRRTEVPFPTQELTLVPASSAHDLASALIHDPRTVLLDLAAGRLLMRRYVREEPATRTRTEMQGEVRIYLLDGSESMIGPRARMRDAILVAELATLMRRLERPRPGTRVVLFYRYFSHVLGKVARVDTVDEAIAAISAVMSTGRSGGTDIQGALLASLALVREAKGQDPDLARAQIVLISDGEAEVVEAAIDAALAACGEVTVGVSVIALGQENDALRRHVARQRRRGERAFYHFLPDATLERLSRGEVDGGPPVHLSSLGEGVDLEAALGPVLEELADLERARAVRQLSALDASDRHQRIERPAEPAVSGEGDRARLEARFSDVGAVARRFDRWFPRPERARGAEPTDASPEPGTLEREDLDSILVLFAAIVEVLEVVGSSPRERQADAVDLLERLLPNGRLTPARYHEVLRRYPGQVAPLLDAVRAVTQQGLRWRLGRTLESPSSGRGRGPDQRDGT